MALPPMAIVARRRRRRPGKDAADLPRAVVEGVHQAADLHPAGGLAWPQTVASHPDAEPYILHGEPRGVEYTKQHLSDSAPPRLVMPGGTVIVAALLLR